MSGEMTNSADRLEEIKNRDPMESPFSDRDWLIAEVERLRDLHYERTKLTDKVIHERDDLGKRVQELDNIVSEHEGLCWDLLLAEDREKSLVKKVEFLQSYVFACHGCSGRHEADCPVLEDSNDPRA